MRVIALIFSMFTFLYLIINFIGSNQEIALNKSLNKTPVLTPPASIMKKKLAAEIAWEIMKNAREKLKHPDNKIKAVKINKDVLLIGDKKYTLYGVFNADQQATSISDTKNSSTFILIKAEGQAMQKILVGEQLSTDVVLLSIKQNNISFQRENETFEFKLFERKL